MILLIDIGNTSTKIATYNIKTDKINYFKSFITCKKKTISKIMQYKKGKNIKYSFVSSVVPSVYDIIKRNLNKNKIKVFEFKDKKIKKKNYN